TFTPAPPPARAAISAVPVNVRTGPDISYPALLSVNELGARYDITGRLETGGWWRICCVNGRDGWIADEGVTVDGDLTAVPALPLPAPQVVVEVERLNVRGGPSVDYPVLALVAAGTVFEIGGRLNDGTWWEVCCLDDGGSGWVIAESVTVWGVTDGVPVVEVPPLPTEEE
ncbi:MAG: SH3 domain-containing protein, partial [Anaerolineales bacterium]|nr:SH3 domain-containing protein [Anaerolineales bacterium]